MDKSVLVSVTMSGLLRVELYVICLGVLTCNVYSLRFLSRVICTYLWGLDVNHACVLHFYICIFSAPVSMSSIEKRCRNKSTLQTCKLAPFNVSSGSTTIVVEVVIVAIVVATVAAVVVVSLSLSLLSIRSADDCR